MPGVFAPILLATANGADPSTWGWAALVRHSGLDALRQASLPDKTLYLGFAMAVAGVLSLIAWRNLLPARNDVDAISALPVHPATAIVARLLALFSYIGVLSASVHVLPSIAFGVLLATGNTAGFAVRGVIAHFVASVAASLCACLVVVGVQGLLILPRSRLFALGASFLHWVAPGLVVAAVLSLPTLVEEVIRIVQGSGSELSAWIELAPPFWFLGVYEEILGTNSQVLQQASSRGWSALVLTGTFSTLVYVVAYRSLLSNPLRFDTAELWGSRAGRRLCSAWVSLIVRHGPARAVARFYLMTLVRGPRQQAVVASALGAAIAWSFPAVFSTVRHWGEAPRPEFLVWPFAMLVFGVAGLRAAAAIPVDRPSDWLFDFICPRAMEIRRAVSRIILTVVVLPVAGGSTLFYWKLWGAGAALAHLAVAASYGVLLIEVVLWRSTRMPGCGHVHLNLEHLRLWWPAYLIAFSAGTGGLAAVEYLVIDSPVAAVLLGAYLLSVARLIHRYAKSAGEDGRPLTIQADAEESWYSGISFSAGEILTEIRLAVRRLAKAPVFSLAAVVTLAGGIGVTTVAWVLLSSTGAPTGISEPANVFALEAHPLRTVSWPHFVQLRQAQKSFLSLEAWSDLPAAVAGFDAAFLTEGTLVTGGFFNSLGVSPLVGRLVQPADEQSGAARVAVFSEDVWRRQFGARAELVGSSLHIGDDLYQVIGIVPSSFRGLGGRAPGVYVPINQPPLTDRDLAAVRDSSQRASSWLHAFGRMRPGLAVREAQAETLVLGRTLDAGRGTSWSITPVEEASGAADAAETGWLLFLVPATVLLVACTNLANLVLARGASRQAELSIRRALGASRWSLLQSHFIEIGILGTVGGALAWVLASAGLVFLHGFVQATFGYAPRWQAPQSMAWSAFPFMCVTVLSCVLVAGFLPALQLTRRPLSPNAINPQFAPPSRGRAYLVSAQVALSVTLLLVAALATRVVREDAHPEGDLALRQLAVVSVPFSLQHRDETVVREVAGDVLSRASRLPAVEAVTAISAFPAVGGCCIRLTAAAPGVHASGPGSFVAGDVDMFRALGISIVQGREFGASDSSSAPPVVIVNESYARQLFGEGVGIGREVQIKREITRVTRAPSAATIVGIARDVRSPRTGRIENIAYAPLAQEFDSNLIFVARVRDGADTSAAAEQLGRLVRERDSRAAASFSGRAEVFAGGAALALRLAGGLAAALSLVALVLSMTGLYGVLSHLVTSRRTELGVRLALGAEPRDLVRLVFIDGLKAIAVGVLAGTGLAILARLSAQPLLVRFVSAIDWSAVLIVVASLLATGVLACVLPARRASKTDPLVVIRNP